MGRLSTEERNREGRKEGRKEERKGGGGRKGGREKEGRRERKKEGREEESYFIQKICNKIYILATFHNMKNLIAWQSYDGAKSSRICQIYVHRVEESL